VIKLTTGDDGITNGAIVRPDPADASTEFAISARVVVNATGVWSDDLRALDEGAHPRSIRPAKGVHVTLPADRLPCDVAAVIPVPSDHRAIFVVPWPETNLVYLGTTDTDYQGPLDDPSCTPEDVDYLLEAANNVTTSHLTRADVTGVWAGLRPLLAPPEKGGHVSERTADLSRRHTVRTSAHGVVTVTGGKLTTYRKMAEDTVDAVVRQLGESPKTRRCITKSLRLLGATSATKDPVAMATPLAHLLSRYGTESAAVLALAVERPELLEPVIEGLPYTGAELLYAAREEMAQTLGDVLARRTRAMIQRAQPTMAAAGAAATLIAPELGWDEAQASEQSSHFIETCQKELLTAGLDLP
jgi:glycerol-3-phosphate dehydrogenase